MKYQRNPLEIDAFQWNGETESSEWPEWFNDAVTEGKVLFPQLLKQDDPEAKPETCMMIGEGQNVRIGLVFYFILRDEMGDISVCKPDVFTLIFSPAD